MSKVSSMTKLQKLKQLSQEFADFLSYWGSGEVNIDKRFHPIDLVDGTASPNIELADEAVFSALCVNKLESKKVAMLYLIAWLYFRDRVDEVFDRVADMSEKEALTVAVEGVDALLGNSARDRQFKRAFERVLEAVRRIK